MYTLGPVMFGNIHDYLTDARGDAMIILCTGTIMAGQIPSGESTRILHLSSVRPLEERISSDASL